MLYVYFLFAIRCGNRNAALPRGQQRNIKNAIRLNYLSRFEMNDLFIVGKERIVFKQGLP